MTFWFLPITSLSSPTDQIIFSDLARNGSLHTMGDLFLPNAHTPAAPLPAYENARAGANGEHAWGSLDFVDHADTVYLKQRAFVDSCGLQRVAYLRPFPKGESGLLYQLLSLR